MTSMYQPSGSITIPNDDALRIVLAKTETPGARGTPVVPTYKLYGDLKLDRTKPLVDREQYQGGFDPWTDPVYGPVDVSGTYQEPLAYEDFAILLRYGVKGQVTGVTDGNATPGYTYTYTPTRAVDDLDSFTAEFGVPGMPWTASMLIFNQFTISADIDDAEAVWKWSANLFGKNKDLKPATTFTATSATATTITKTAAGWTVNAFAEAYVEITGGLAGAIGQVRRIVSNTVDTLTVSPAFITTPDATSICRISGTFTTGVADRSVELIAAPATLIYIDPTTIGTTLATQKVISWSVTLDNGLYGKRFMENVSGYSNKLGRGKRMCTGTLRMEFDTRDEYDAFVASERRYLRFKQTGSTINVSPATTKLAQIDLTRVFWDTPNVNDLRNSNIVASFPFRAYFDSATGFIGSWIAKTTQATLP